MRHYAEAAVERAMKVQEVILRAAAKKITWIQAARARLNRSSGGARSLYERAKVRKRGSAHGRRSGHVALSMSETISHRPPTLRKVKVNFPMSSSPFFCA